jgi:hypothetical protein
MLDKFEKPSILILLIFFLNLIEGILFVSGKMSRDSEKNNCRWFKEKHYSG